MNNEQIETFLAVAEKGSLRKAAEELYVEQGTVSRRIAELENEMNIRLFYRQKGVRSTSLTEHGEMFLPIAQQFSALYHDALDLENTKKTKKLRITATNAVTEDFLLPFYRRFMDEHTDIELYTQCEHSKEIYQMVESQQTDLGFVTSIYQYPNVATEFLRSEEFVILCHRSHPYAKSHRKNDLEDADELYAVYSKDFENWHANTFPYASRKRITFGTLSMYKELLKDNLDAWMILPESSAAAWTSAAPDWTYIKMRSAPKRNTFILSHKYPKPGMKTLISLFVEELTKEMIL
ncbi:MAG: LysR family transcriptional regulator [Erysipelotrichaceae bacterium]|nr:LysR family transcriptional regulator [Erysipelotrichaceae bacterium]